jgi:hypothetical protein
MNFNLISITKISVAHHVSKMTITVVTLDQFQKPIGNSGNVTLTNLGPQNFIPNNEIQFNPLKDPHCKVVKITLEEHGFLSTSEFGTVLFDISFFKEDLLAVCEFDILNLKRENVGRIGLKILIPGVNFHKKTFYPHALKNEFGLCQIHFHRNISSKNFIDEGDLSNRSLGGMIQQIIQFCNTNESIFEPVDFESHFESNTPDILLTVAFKTEFIHEAKLNYKELKMDTKDLSFVCDSKVDLDSISLNQSKGLQAKILQRLNISTSYSLDFHHKNKLEGLKFIEKFKDQIDVISKDFSIRNHTQFGLTTTPGYSFVIIWYYVKKSETIHVVKQEENEKKPELIKQEIKIEKEETKSIQNISIPSQEGNDLYPSPKEEEKE